MKLTARTPQFTIYDDVLPSADFKTIWRWMQMQPLQPSQWGMSPYNGNPLEGKRVFNWASDRIVAEVPIDTWLEGLVRVPSGEPIDMLADVFHGLSSQADSPIGRPDQDFGVIQISPFVHRQGDGIFWHRDSPDYAGAFIMYVHQSWNAHWGGELIVAHPDTKVDREKYPQLPLERDEVESEQLMDPGWGSYIIPKPNRLVLIHGGEGEHKVARVDKLAGHHVRAALTGFFIKPQRCVKWLTAPDPLEQKNPKKAY